MATDKTPTTNTTPTGHVRGIDVLLPGVVEVRHPATGALWRLRDDIASTLGFLMFRVQELAGAIPSGADVLSVPVKDTLAAIAAYERELFELCALAVRHTYPEMTDAQVAEMLPTTASRQAVLTAFFTSPSAASSAPPSATPASSSAILSTANATTTTTTTSQDRALAVSGSSGATRAAAHSSRDVTPTPRRTSRARGTRG